MAAAKPAPKSKAETPPKPASAGPFVIAGQTMYFDLPPSPAIRSSVRGALADIGEESGLVRLLLSACVGLCWTGGRAKAGAPRYSHRVFDYGAEFFDWIVGEAVAAGHDEGETMSEIAIAGNKALDLLMASGIRQSDLDEAKKNWPVKTADGSEKSSE